MNEKRFYRIYSTLAISFFLILVVAPICFFIYQEKEFSFSFTKIQNLNTLYTLCLSLVCSTLGLISSIFLSRYNFTARRFLLFLYAFIALLPVNTIMLILNSFIRILTSLLGLKLIAESIIVSISLIYKASAIACLLSYYYFQFTDFKNIIASRALGYSKVHSFLSLYFSRFVKIYISLFFFVFSILITIESSIICFLFSLISLLFFCLIQKNNKCATTKDFTYAKGFSLFCLFVFIFLSLVLILIPILNYISSFFLTDDFSFSINLFKKLLEKDHIHLILTLTYYIIASLLATFLGFFFSILICKRKKFNAFYLFLGLFSLCLTSALLDSSYNYLIINFKSINYIIFEVLKNIVHLYPVTVILLCTRMLSTNNALIKVSRSLGFNMQKSFKNTQMCLLTKSLYSSFLINLSLLLLNVETLFILSVLLFIIAFNLRGDNYNESCI